MMYLSSQKLVVSSREKLLTSAFSSIWTAKTSLCSTLTTVQTQKKQFQLRVFPHSYSHRQRISNDPDSGLIPERVSPQSRARSRCLFRRAVSQSLAFYRPSMPQHSNVKILVHFRFSHQSAPVRNESTCYVCAGLPCSRSVSSQERSWCGPEKKRSHL